MVKFKVPLKDILLNAYYQYELTSSNYNPKIDNTITITCICKNVLGNPVANKELILLMNEVEQGTATTNANGIATWQITFGDWGNQHFNVGTATLDLLVTGWKEINVDTGRLLVNEFMKNAIYLFSRTGTITSEITYSNVIPTNYRPMSVVRMKAHNSSVQAFIIIEPNGNVKVGGGTTSTSITVACQMQYNYGV